MCTAVPSALKSLVAYASAAETQCERFDVEREVMAAKHGSYAVLPLRLVSPFPFLPSYRFASTLVALHVSARH